MAARIIRSNIPPNTTHRLYVRKVTGSPGKFTSMATYCETAAVCEGWKHGSIHPGPKTTKLAKSGSHVIHVVVSFDKLKADACEVVSELDLAGGTRRITRLLQNNATGSDHVEIRLGVL